MDNVRPRARIILNPNSYRSVSAAKLRKTYVELFAFTGTFSKKDVECYFSETISLGEL